MNESKSKKEKKGIVVKKGKKDKIIKEYFSK